MFRSYRTIQVFLLVAVVVVISFSLIACGNGIREQNDQDGGSAETFGASSAVEKMRVLVTESDSAGEGYAYDYDENGRQIAKYEMDFKQNTMSSCTLSDYDESGKISSNKVYEVDQYDVVNGACRLGDLVETTTYSYETDTWHVVKVNNDGVTTWEGDYDRHDNLVESRRYNVFGSLQEHNVSVYEYDAGDRITKVVTDTDLYGSSDAHYTRTVEREYDSDGKLVHDVEQGGMRSEEDVDQVYEYDELNRVEKVDSSNGKYDIYQYDSADSVLPSKIESHNSNGSVIQTKVYEYDTNSDNCTYQAILGPDGAKQSERTYVYDDLANVLDSAFVIRSSSSSDYIQEKDGGSAAFSSVSRGDFVGVWYFVGAQEIGGGGGSDFADTAQLTKEYSGETLVLSENGTYSLFNDMVTGNWEMSGASTGYLYTENSRGVLSLSRHNDEVGLRIADEEGGGVMVFSSEPL